MLATGIAFIFLAFKYVDVAARYPDGGGVVSVASDAFGPFIGCIGGMLICVDYFLTGAISSVSGFQYLSAALPGLTSSIAPAACAALIVLGALNYIGIRESAVLTAVLAVGSLIVNLVVLAVVGGAPGRSAPAAGDGSVHGGGGAQAVDASWSGSAARGWRSRGSSRSARSRPRCRSRASGPRCGPCCWSSPAS